MTKILWTRESARDAILATIEQRLGPTDETASDALSYLQAPPDREDDRVYSSFGLDTIGYEVAKTGNSVMTSIHRQIGLVFEQCWRGLIAINAGIHDPDRLETKKTAEAMGVSVERKYDCVLDNTTLPNTLPREFERSYSGFKQRVMEIAIRQLDDRTSKRGRKNETLLKAAEKALKEKSFRGIGFEIRHCYKSADSKRKQGDLQAAAGFIADGLLPVMIVFCKEATQMHDYRRNGWVVFEGDDAFKALSDLSGFDLASFLDEEKDEICERLLPNMTTFFESLSFENSTD